ncbi:MULTISPECIES: GFA family protein [Paraburkholderia]|uniref:GFA family protein n=1 Tax=Paraburkholderia podalyriae TaxID=1938811 RepID=A0ABR7PTE1_9BURK|nr:GFA family protein [Paraburkholderia podalyriae]MBC8749547.1 GFA family protein [Paraburkholderia podalyriae]
MRRHTASCHCGAIRFAFDVQIDEVVICKCSLCAKRHAVMVGVPRDSLQILEGHSALSSYRWNTGQACHYFCSTCGIYTFHQRRIDPAMYSVNAFCIDGLDVPAIPLRHVDGSRR